MFPSFPPLSGAVSAHSECLASDDDTVSVATELSQLHYMSANLPQLSLQAACGGAQLHTRCTQTALPPWPQQGAFCSGADSAAASDPNRMPASQLMWFQQQLMMQQRQHAFLLERTIQRLAPETGRNNQPRCSNTASGPRKQAWPAAASDKGRRKEDIQMDTSDADSWIEVEAESSSRVDTVRAEFEKTMTHSGDKEAPRASNEVQEWGTDVDGQEEQKRKAWGEEEGMGPMPWGPAGWEMRYPAMPPQEGHAFDVFVFLRYYGSVTLVSIDGSQVSEEVQACEVLCSRVWTRMVTDAKRLERFVIDHLASKGLGDARWALVTYHDYDNVNHIRLRDLQRRQDVDSRYGLGLRWFQDWLRCSGLAITEADVTHPGKYWLADSPW
mmetsp:Transcript_51612/g.95541  ORF Transcript_51612/g.95541 Transcript_51612/m.95541 type:complete len:384 (-) Transcript_51612:62-1213(-)